MVGLDGEEVQGAFPGVGSLEACSRLGASGPPVAGHA